ncbi:MAG TPA: TlyA family RNA methyltransferase [Patescibacteria group bacterium]|nr:TlyA family RNA methyltransferase [Patescibacteria group bacterium]
MKQRLDTELVRLGLVATRSQAESYIKLGKVSVDGRVIARQGYFVNENAKIKLDQQEQYVSRAGLKLASVADKLKMDFKDKIVLDVGSSTGGFTDFALRNGAKRVIAVDVGTKQLHTSLLDNPKIELHEQTDIRYFILANKPDIVLIDVSFISLREVLPHVTKISGPNTQVLAMLKPQFEAGDNSMHKGVIKNDTMRRDIIKHFEDWAKKYFVIINKADSAITGAKGNQERFYLLIN